MAVAAVKADALAARLAGLTVPASGAWLTAARVAAGARLAAMGLPVRRDEYWRYTDPARLNARDAVGAMAPAGDLLGSVDAVRLVFVDGVFDAAASDDPARAGVEVSRLAEAGAKDIHWAREVYGVLEVRGQKPVARPFAALASAYATDGVLIRATARAACPVMIVYRSVSDTSDPILHHCVKVEAGAEMTLIETGAVGARGCTVLEVDVAEGASFHHLRAQGPEPERMAVTHLFARLAARAAFKSFTLSAQGRLTRNEAVIEFAGDDASAHIAGAVLGDGLFHQDDTVFVTHAAERCESRQVFKKVLSNGATGVFQGKILVRKGAQKTDGYQISQALLLDEASQFLAKPELEIYADDVKCSHGSTTGAIDETALFYLRARGVPLKAAQALLVLAFLSAAVEEIADPALAEEVQALLEAWLALGAGGVG